MPPSRRSDDLTIVIVAFALMAMLTVAAFVVAPVDSSPRTTGSSFSARSDGAKAAYLVLKQLGYAIDRSYDPITALASRPPETTLVLASPAEGPSQQDVRALRSFVQDGGVLLAYGRSAAAFIPGATPQDAYSDLGDKPREFSASAPSPLTVGAPMVIARTIPTPNLDPSFVAVFGSVLAPAVVTARLGRGRIVWSLDEMPVTNEGLPRASNVRLLANAVGTPGARRILWDEHYHGQRRSMWSYFARTPLLWAGAQLSFAALLALTAVARRRGPIRTRAVTPRTSPLEFVETMASLYERAGAGQAAIEGARARLRRRLSAGSGVSRRASEDTVVEAAARLGVGEGRVRTALQSAADLLRRGVPRPADTVPVVAELQALAAAVDGARSGQGHHT